MAFLAVVLALLIEHVRPLARGNAVHAAIGGFAAAVRSRFDGGERSHGALGWAVVMLGSVGAVWLAEWIAESLHPLFVFALHVFVLYCTLGFRQFSLAFAEIQVALAAGDPEGARRVLDDWIDGEAFDRTAAEEVPAVPEPETETCRRAIAHALVAAHREVLGPLFAYMLVPGAPGPVIYRVAAMLARRWAGEPPTRWGDFAGRAFAVIDWLPARLSAAGFAIAGNFEDAVYCWRGATANRAGRSESRSLLLAAGSGALRVRVGDSALEGRWAEGERGFECPGVAARPASLQAAAGLVWRSLVLWLALFALITVSAWMGR